MLKKLFIALSFLLIISQSYYAQTFAVGPQIGYHKSEDADGSLMLGGAGRLYLARSFALEASINYRSEEYESGAVKTKMYPIMLSGMLYALPILYGTVGAGWYNTSVEYSKELNALGFKDETISKFGYHLGLGAEIELGKP